jgi:prepilin-type processing-associated H-X9-DG protein
VEGENAWRGGEATTIAECQKVAIGYECKVFRCPSRNNVTVFAESWYTPPGYYTHAMTDYAASNWENTGVITQLSGINIARITDGSSNTLLAGEKQIDLAYLGQLWGDNNEGYTAAWDDDTMRKTTLPPLPDANSTNGWGGSDEFGSSHAQMFNVVFADGSVHGIRYEINPTTFKYLGDRSDGQVVDPNEY